MNIEKVDIEDLRKIFRGENMSNLNAELKKLQKEYVENIFNIKKKVELKKKIELLEYQIKKENPEYQYIEKSFELILGMMKELDKERNKKRRLNKIYKKVLSVYVNFELYYI